MMTEPADKLAAALRRGPHTFDRIRTMTGLTLDDAQMSALVVSEKERFKPVRFLKRDDEGKQIRPGRPGVRLTDSEGR